MPSTSGAGSVIRVVGRAHMSTALEIGYFVLLVSFLSGAAISFDRLIRFERQFHSQAWEQDGKPWFGSLGGGRGWKRCWLAWLFITPGWTKTDTSAIHLLIIYRIWFGALAVGMLLGMVIRSL